MQDFSTVPIHVHLQHQVEKLILSWVLSHRSHDSQQLLGGDCSAPILTWRERDWDNVTEPSTTLPNTLHSILYTYLLGLSDRVPLTLSNASNASFSSAFSKLAKSEDIICPCYLSASPDRVEVERNF